MGSIREEGTRVRSDVVRIASGRRKPGYEDRKRLGSRGSSVAEALVRESSSPVRIHVSLCFREFRGKTVLNGVEFVNVVLNPKILAAVPDVAELKHGVTIEFALVADAPRIHITRLQIRVQGIDTPVLGNSVRECRLVKVRSRQVRIVRVSQQRTRAEIAERCVSTKVDARTARVRSEKVNEKQGPLANKSTRVARTYYAFAIRPEERTQRTAKVRTPDDSDTRGEVVVVGRRGRFARLHFDDLRIGSGHRSGFEYVSSTGDTVDLIKRFKPSVIRRKRNIGSLRLPTNSKIEGQVISDLPRILSEHPVRVLFQDVTGCRTRIEFALSRLVCPIVNLSDAAGKNGVKLTSFGQLAGSRSRHGAGRRKRDRGAARIAEHAERCSIRRGDPGEVDRINDQCRGDIVELDPLPLSTERERVLSGDPCQVIRNLKCRR